MTQTNAQLRERIAEEIHANVPSFTEMHICRDIADQIIALLSPTDTGLASVVGEIDALFEEATPAPWKHHREQGPYTYRDEIWCDSPCKDEPEWLSPIFDEIPNKEDAHLVVALVNNWPAIRAALTTGGSGWRPELRNAVTPALTPALRSPIMTPIDETLRAKKALTEQELIEWATAGPAKRGLSIDTVERLIWQNKRLSEELSATRSQLEAAEQALAEIGAFAHDNSTGPTIPDAFWSIRDMAYRPLETREQTDARIKTEVEAEL